MKFTTSWDDGYSLDLKIAELLQDHNCTGTFYLCPKSQHGKEMLNKEQIMNLSNHHEIGAHTMAHPKLTQIPKDTAKHEIEESKKWIESITGTQCKLFCYPHGDYNREVMKLVKDAGFMGARTVEDLKFSYKNPFALPTSLQIFPFSKRKMRTMMPSWITFIKNALPNKHTKDWLSLATFLFTYALENNKPFFHLWGHSCEIEKYEMWEDLERFLIFVSQQKVEYAANSGLLTNVSYDQN